MLMTAMRNARNDGPVLCEAHRRVGSYLATEFVTSIIGLEKYPIPHVQGNSTDGFRLRHEDRTLIVPLMRGGEPMARGVWEAFPRAMYRHAKNPADVENEHLEGKVNVIIVDSVVNTGKINCRVCSAYPQFACHHSHRGRCWCRSGRMCFGWYTLSDNGWEV